MERVAFSFLPSCPRTNAGPRSRRPVSDLRTFVRPSPLGRVCIGMALARAMAMNVIRDELEQDRDATLRQTGPVLGR